MYKITNLNTGIQSTCDAIETIIWFEGQYIPSDEPDGFKALTIIHVSPEEEYYEEAIYAFEGHILSGEEATGTYEFIEDEELEEEEEIINEENLTL